MSPNPDDVVTIRLTDFYLCFWSGDDALTQILTDPRTEIVAPTVAKALWRAGDLDVAALWNAPDVDLFSRLFLHYWHHALAFDYLDVGAHCGITCFPRAIFIRRCDQNSRVFAFEPGKHFALLERGVSLNGLADLVTPVEAAASDASGPVTFHYLPNHTAGSSLLPRSAEVASGFRMTRTDVRGISLDDFAHETQLSRNLICKVDTEGFDFKVIDGMQESIKKGYVSMQIELVPRLVDSYADPVARLVDFAQEFCLLEVKRDGSCHPIAPGPETIARFVQLVRQSEHQYTDVLLLPRKLPGLQDLLRRIARQPDDERIAFIRGSITKLGGAIRSAIDLAPHEGHHALRTAELPGVEHVVCLQGRDSTNRAVECRGPVKVHFHVYDPDRIRKFPQPETGPFDLAVCAGLLHHMSRPWEAVAWMSAASTKYLFVDTHYAELPLYRSGPYVGEVHPGMASGDGHNDYAFWPTLGDLLMILMQHGFVPRFIYRYSAGHHFQPRIWIFAEKGDSSAELNGTNPLRPDIMEQLPDLSLGPQPSAFNALEVHAAAIKAGVTPFNPETERREAAEAELAHVFNSRSWRVTAPLRWVYSRLYGSPSD